MVKSWKGDGYCDDENNNPGCEWDGGDCCKENIKKTYCKDCKCFCKDADFLLSTCQYYGKNGKCSKASDPQFILGSCKKSCGMC